MTIACARSSAPAELVESPATIEPLEQLPVSLHRLAPDHELAPGQERRFVVAAPLNPILHVPALRIARLARAAPRLTAPRRA